MSRAKPSLAVCGALFMLATCTRPPTSTPQERALRVRIEQAEYGAHPTHAQALAPGDRLQLDRLALADGGQLVLAEALAAGPVLFVWIGGAEHEALTTWVQSLDTALPELELRGANLVFVRSLEVAAALRWAVDLRLQTTVACDLDEELGEALDLLRVPDRGELAVDFAVLVIGAQGEVAYRKLGGRRPQLDELLAVLDGRADTLACCPGACVGAPCVPVAP